MKRRDWGTTGVMVFVSMVLVASLGLTTYTSIQNGVEVRQARQLLQFHTGEFQAIQRLLAQGTRLEKLSQRQAAQLERLSRANATLIGEICHATSRCHLVAVRRG